MVNTAKLYASYQTALHITAYGLALLFIKDHYALTIHKAAEVAPPAKQQMVAQNDAAPKYNSDELNWLMDEALEEMNRKGKHP